MNKDQEIEIGDEEREDEEVDEVSPMNEELDTSNIILNKENLQPPTPSQSKQMQPQSPMLPTGGYTPQLKGKLQQ